MVYLDMVNNCVLRFTWVNYIVSFKKNNSTQVIKVLLATK